MGAMSGSAGSSSREGVVIYHVAADKMFKKTLKGDEHKGAKDASTA